MSSEPWPGANEAAKNQHLFLSMSDRKCAYCGLHEDAWVHDSHEVFVTDDGIVPICDICGGPQMVEGDLWNGETGNHYSCEEVST